MTGRSSSDAVAKSERVMFSFSSCDVMVIDVGANVECAVEHLAQFALLGSGFVRGTMGIEKPRVCLLNNGTEASKGTSLQLEAYPVFQQMHEEGKINFCGNAEAKDIMQGVCDVVVCDGFSGNILLKSIEGTANFIMSGLKDITKKSLRAKIGALLIKKDLYALKDKMSATKVGGTALLGISKPVIKAHGSSNAEALFNAVRQAAAVVSSGVIDTVTEQLRNPES